MRAKYRHLNPGRCVPELAVDKRVLVVDDEPWVADLVSQTLSDGGYEVRTVGDGESALQAVSDFRPDLVVLDVMLPKENGYRVSRKLKTGETDNSGPAPKVLLLTGRRLDHDPDREKMFMDFSMADGLLYKPFDLDDLRRTVHQLFGDWLRNARQESNSRTIR